MKNDIRERVDNLEKEKCLTSSYMKMINATARSLELEDLKSEVLNTLFKLAI